MPDAEEPETDPTQPGATDAGEAGGGVKAWVVIVVAVAAAAIAALIAVVVVLAVRKPAQEVKGSESQASPSISAPTPSASASPSASKSPAQSASPTKATKTANEVGSEAAAALNAGNRSAFVALASNESEGGKIYDTLKKYWGNGPYKIASCSASGSETKCNLHVSLEGSQQVGVLVIKDTSSGMRIVSSDVTS